MNERYFTDYIRPELLILVPVLYIIGTWLKKSTVKDERIPLTLGGIGVLLAALYVLASSTLCGLREWLAAVFGTVTQGVLCAGAAVFVHQLVRQSEKRKACDCASVCPPEPRPGKDRKPSGRM